MAHQSGESIPQARAAQARAAQVRARAARQPEELDWAQAPRRVPAQKVARVTLLAAQEPRSVAPEA